MIFMESTGLRMRTLNFTSAFVLRYTHRTRPFFRTDLRRLFSHKPYKISLQSIRFSSRQLTHRCSAERSYSTDRSHDVDGVSNEASDKMLQVVLVSPQIPGNTGCIARTCAASAVGLHLVEPLGFQVDDAKLKRAGLDYWPYVVVKVHGSWGEFIEYFQRQEGEKRLLAFTKRGTSTHSDFSYKRGDWLVFGAETFGLPPEALLDCKNEPFGGGTVRIPMIETYVRCLNLSVSVGIALYEAARQLNYEQLQLPQGPCINDQQLFVKEDIFA